MLTMEQYTARPPARPLPAALQQLNGIQYEGRVITVKYDKYA